MERERKSRGFVPEIVTLAAAELPVVVTSIQSILEKSPINPDTFLPLVAFWTFYVGLPAAIVVRVFRLCVFNKPNKPSDSKK